MFVMDRILDFQHFSPFRNGENKMLKMGLVYSESKGEDFGVMVTKQSFH
jgi:hypothetical protein